MLGPIVTIQQLSPGNMSSDPTQQACQVGAEVQRYARQVLLSETVIPVLCPLQ